MVTLKLFLYETNKFVKKIYWRFALHKIYTLFLYWLLNLRYD